MTAQDVLTFYDIASGPPVRPFAPNLWKVRYALNFKKANYTTEWVDLADVAAKRQSLCDAPSRYHADGEPFHTLPVVRDGATGAVVGDSFDIAVFLEAKHPGPGAPRLFRAGVPVGFYAAFNAHADAVFPLGAGLAAERFPFNPATAAASQAEFCRRAGKPADAWDDMVVRGPARRPALDAFEKALAPFARHYRFAEADGPFLGGRDPDYADFIVGGWLMMYVETVAEWEGEISKWHGGVWGRLHDALAPYRGTW